MKIKHIALAICSSIIILGSITFLVVAAIVEHNKNKEQDETVQKTQSLTCAGGYLNACEKVCKNLELVSNLRCDHLIKKKPNIIRDLQESITVSPNAPSTSGSGQSPRTNPRPKPRPSPQTVPSPGNGGDRGSGGGINLPDIDLPDIKLPNIGL